MRFWSRLSKPSQSPKASGKSRRRRSSRHESPDRQKKPLIPMPPKQTALAYYVSAHGFGHGVRSSDIIRAFDQSYPEVQVIIVSDLPVSFLKNRLSATGNSFRAASFDV